MIIFSLRNLLESAFNYFVYWLVSKKVAELTTSENLARYIKLFQELIFDETDESASVTSREMYENAFRTIKQFIYTETKLEKLAKGLLIFLATANIWVFKINLLFGCI